MLEKICKDYLRRRPDVAGPLGEWVASGVNVNLSGLAGGAKPFALALAAACGQKKMAVISPDGTSSRNCQRIHGSTGFKADKRWDKGHKYTHISAGKDYGLTGLHMKVRNMPSAKRQLGNVANDRVVVKKTFTKQAVKKVQVRPSARKAVVRKQRQPSYSGQVIAPNKRTMVKRGNSHKDSQANIMSMRSNDRKATKPIVRPHVVQKAVKHNKSLRVSGRSIRADVTRPDVVRKVDNEKHREAVKPNHRDKESQKVERADKAKNPRKAAVGGRQNTVRSQRQYGEEKTAAKKVQENETVNVDSDRAVDNEKSRGKSNRYETK